MTKQQLIDRWLARFPQDVNHPDLEGNAVAGYVECNDGQFRNWAEYERYEQIIKNDYKPDWSRWLFTRLMTLKQKRQIAVFSAEQVLHIFESKYPDDKRPRQAIEAAKAIIENDSIENRKSAAAAAYAADAPAYSAAAAAYAAYAAAYAAYAAADAAAAYAAYAADASKRKELQEKIIAEAVRLLEIDSPQGEQRRTI